MQRSLRRGIAFDEVFDLPEDQLHQQSLRTGPTAPEPAKSRCEDKDAGDENERGQSKDDPILRPEDLAEDGEPAFDNVEQEQRVAVDAHEWPHEHDRQEQIAQPGAPRVKPATGLLGIEPAPPAALVGRREVIPEIAPVDLLADGVGILRLGRRCWAEPIQTRTAFAALAGPG